ncbi:DUF1287 domain-containing protein [Flavobacterium sp.]|jgi:uncharacterized protein YijF (DUF1287 family)|uniref:DUF1287 domain-containing protein n=1 Tax=Flavobacterium sp. TaxID=239 RepID=UPI0022BAD4D2|nr:DUF1287 domain-containing protein [Flavobacterium sp.]MCZ8144400.1 DUF1287 domain-containing protein [Flavobacterium sp.]MCZ8366583.1 DUF1287 domain-containing protein [Flavobacterium sp.]
MSDSIRFYRKYLMNYLFLFVLLFFSCQQSPQNAKVLQGTSSNPFMDIKPIASPKNFGEKLSNAALQVIDSSVVYTPDYVALRYPGGDVPPKTGVCTDVVIRAYRKCAIDLQKEVHEDMQVHFERYPTIKKWGLKTTDKNIDHRRVPNLEVFFSRKGKKLALSNNPSDYLPGDIVTWLVNGKLPHIGIVTHIKKEGIPMIVHNIGGGQIIEACLFKYPMVGHFRYDGK